LLEVGKFFEISDGNADRQGQRQRRTRRHPPCRRSNPRSEHRHHHNANPFIAWFHPFHRKSFAKFSEFVRFYIRNFFMKHFAFAKIFTKTRQAVSNIARQIAI